MTDTQKLSEIARERLRKEIVRQASRATNIGETAILARVDAAIAVSTAEAVFMLLHRKNLISVAELERALADSYGDAADFLAAHGCIAIAKGN